MNCEMYTHTLNQPTYTIQVYEVVADTHSAKSQCLFLSPAEIQQSYGKYYDRPFQPMSDTLTASAHIPEPPAHQPHTSLRSAGGECG